MNNRVVFTIPGKDILVVIRKGKTTNKKISNDAPLVQTYTFSTAQWTLASTSKGFGMNKFFALDGANCLDCPYSGNMGEGGCYTHKFNQYIGFLSMLRSIKHEELTPLTRDKQQQIIELSFNKLESLPSRLFDDLVNLKKINLNKFNKRDKIG